eukprot:TRINITY_DN44204_c0_g1_i4.p1 TRINITY_DN44204_c0_g1~~TRINITY_DN44204_c0_g1_i4.p1  ORF type:complete len:566 (+),score=92.97 TRINITY_DN44204_c0_g1_i4:179-1876(+)
MCIRDSSAAVRCVCSYGPGLFASASDDGQVFCWGLDAKQPGLRAFKLGRICHSGGAWGVRHVRQGVISTWGDDGMLKFWKGAQFPEAPRGEGQQPEQAQIDWPALSREDCIQFLFAHLAGDGLVVDASLLVSVLADLADDPEEHQRWVGSYGSTLSSEQFTELMRELLPEENSGFATAAQMILRDLVHLVENKGMEIMMDPMLLLRHDAAVCAMSAVYLRVLDAPGSVEHGDGTSALNLEDLQSAEEREPVAAAVSSSVFVSGAVDGAVLLFHVNETFDADGMVLKMELNSRTLLRPPSKPDSDGPPFGQRVLSVAGIESRLARPTDHPADFNANDKSRLVISHHLDGSLNCWELDYRMETGQALCGASHPLPQKWCRPSRLVQLSQHTIALTRAADGECAMFELTVSGTLVEVGAWKVGRGGEQIVQGFSLGGVPSWVRADCSLCGCSRNGEMSVWGLEYAWEQHLDTESGSVFHYSKSRSKSVWEGPAVLHVLSQRLEARIHIPAANLLCVSDLALQDGSHAQVTGSEDGVLYLVKHEGTFSPPRGRAREDDGSSYNLERLYW